VIQAQNLYNSRNYDNYDWWIFLSVSVGYKGLEHHQTSEDVSRDNYYSDWVAGCPCRALYLEGYVQTCNGESINVFSGTSLK